MVDNVIFSHYLQAEREAIGVDHCQIGYYIAQKWNFPPELCKVILHHHVPGDAEDPWRRSSALCHIADLLSMMSGRGTGSDALLYTVDNAISDYFELSAWELESVLFKSMLEFEKVTTLLDA